MLKMHSCKLHLDINEKDEILAKYHVKEIDKSLIATLEHKISLLGMSHEYSELIKKYKNRLEVYKKKLGMG